MLLHSDAVTGADMGASLVESMTPERKQEVLEMIDDAIEEDQLKPTNITRISSESSLEVLDVLWELLDPRTGIVTGLKRGRPLFSFTLRRLTLKLVNREGQLPSAFYLDGVKSIEDESRGAGGFADIYYGQWKEHFVALKRLRPPSGQQHLDPVSEMQLCRESLMWKKLEHANILPFWGVSKDAFSRSICMVLPWMQKGSVRAHMRKLREAGTWSGQEHTLAVNVWLYQICLGLTYLHGEGIVHGDLHGGNILIDDADNVRLTDFGLGLLAEANPNNYASKHGNGSFPFRAPELHDPSKFGLDDTRHTRESDIYAFGCVVWELYTETVPFGNIGFYKIAEKVVNGERPPRPTTQDGLDISEDMWTITQRCWVQTIADRPPASQVAEDIKNVVDVELPGAIERMKTGQIDIPTTPSATVNQKPEFLSPVIAAGTSASASLVPPPSTVQAPTPAPTTEVGEKYPRSSDSVARGKPEQLPSIKRKESEKAASTQRGGVHTPEFRCKCVVM
ncbi:hypothetical protein EIP91_003771 [Steccherinum ochraceum]|uniref:Protein kinase domain-containing protein n=1 Tax=Steccherinum ochraceum TaxID=92696 RepID=A0A4V2MW56_9APHY|nr:hypothetical protein EIP91_003771 [Steccherinum ochraceum]